MPTIIELGQKVKMKYPEYKDMSDLEVGEKVKSKYPTEYSDFTDTQETPKKENNMLQKLIVNTIGRPAIRGSQALVGIGVNAFGNEQQKENFQNAVEQDTELPMGLGTVAGQKPIGQGGGKQIAIEGAKSLFDAATVGLGGAVNKTLLKGAEKLGASKLLTPVANTLAKTKGGALLNKFLPQVAANATEGVAYNTGYNALNEKPLMEGAGLAAGLSVVLPPAIKGVVKGAGSLIPARTTQEIDRRILNKFEKGVKPLLPGKTTPSTMIAYKDNVANAVRTIHENKANLNFKDELGETISGQNPKSLQQLADSVEQTKKTIFNQYDSLAKEAGDAGVGVSMEPIAGELNSVINNKALAISNPKAIQYAKQLQDRLTKAGKLDAVTAQEVIQNYNKSLEAFYRNPSYDNASQAAIDAMIANNMRKSLDEGITGMTGTKYQQLKNQYGSLKAVEKDIIKASLREARKNTKGLIDFSDIFSGGQVINGILSLNPGMVASGLTQKAIASYYKYLNNPNRSIQKMFNLVERKKNYELGSKPTTIKNITAPANAKASVQTIPLNAKRTGESSVSTKVPITQSKQKYPIKTSSAIPIENKPIDKAELRVNNDLNNRTKSPSTIQNSTEKSRTLPTAPKKGALLDKWKNLPNKEGGFATGIVYKGEKDLTTKILKDLEGKTTVSKQYILDATNRGELKQVERDLIRRILDESDTTKLPLNKIKAVGTKDSFDPFSLDYSKKQIKAGKPLEPIEVRLKDGKYVIEDGEHRYRAYKESGFTDDVPVKVIGSDTINVSDFAKKVKAELLPLKIVAPKDNFGRSAGGGRNMADTAGLGYKYEHVSLPGETRGKVKDYKEHVYESPIKTSAGDRHFEQGQHQGYFGHTRIEDMADNKTRRVIEVQSDLYQKGNLEKEIPSYFQMTDYLPPEKLKRFNYIERRVNDLESAVNSKSYTDEIKELKSEYKKLQSEAVDYKNKTVSSRKKEVSKLQQYNDPTAHFRMVREEIKKAAQDGKTKLQFPTGETAMKIEGLGDQSNWFFGDKLDTQLTPDKLKVGMNVGDPREGTSYIITDVLGDGKFKAVQKDFYETAIAVMKGETGQMLENSKAALSREAESFDISGKVDTSNPIYKFYEKDVQKYLNKFGGKRIVDDKGVSWIEVPITKAQGKAPVEAFGKIRLGALGTGALIGAGGVITAGQVEKRKRQREALMNK